MNTNIINLFLLPALMAGLSPQLSAHAQGTPPPPALQIISSNNQVVVSWPVVANPNNFGLRTSRSLSNNAVWSTVTNGAVLSSDTWSYTNRLNGNAAFYQLAPSSHLYALGGQGGLGAIDTNKLQQEYTAGVRARLLEIGWDVLQPSSTTAWSSGTASTFQQHIDAFVATGSDTVLILDLGMQYPPTWVVNTDPLKDQYGNVMTNAPFGRLPVNVYWSPTVRLYTSNYLRQVFTHLNFRGKLWAVRVGPYEGEVLYPCSTNGSCNSGVGPDGGQSFWAFDATARSKVPPTVTNWIPGQPSPNGEAQIFYNWYVDNLGDTFNFIAGVLRKYFNGYIAPVTPGQGITDESVVDLVNNNLLKTDWCCYGTGNYWQRLFPRFSTTNQNVLFWCSSFGDGSGSDDSSPNLGDWSAAHGMSYFAGLLNRPVFAENPGANAFSTGQCGAAFNTTMQWDFQALTNYHYLGLIWMRESDFGNPCAASLSNYQASISQTP